jgi:hypothetical protein
MAVTAFYYANFFKNIIDNPASAPASFDSGDTIKCMLTTSVYAPNQDTDQDHANVTNEVAGAGYTAGGDTITTFLVTQTANVIDIDGDDAQWTSASFTARYAVVYDDQPAASADKPLMSYINFGADETVASGTFTIQFAAAGIGTITPADAV